MRSEREVELPSEAERASKSERKRQADRLQTLGVELAALPEPELMQLGLPDDLHAALRELRRLPTHGAQLRQRQFIGKLMRRIDADPIIARLAERKRQHDGEVRYFREVERWRERLLGEPEAATELLAEYPQADRTMLTGLLARAARERREQRPPTAARELFAFLRQLIQAPP
jgi:ribosome-associated protein